MLYGSDEDLLAYLEQDPDLEKRLCSLQAGTLPLELPVVAHPPGAAGQAALEENPTKNLAWSRSARVLGEVALGFVVGVLESGAAEASGKVSSPGSTRAMSYQDEA